MPLVLHTGLRGIRLIASSLVAAIEYRSVQTGKPPFEDGVEPLAAGRLTRASPPRRRPADDLADALVQTSMALIEADHPDVSLVFDFLANGEWKILRRAARFTSSLASPIG